MNLDLSAAVEAAAAVEIGMRQTFHHDDGSTSYSEFARVPLGVDAASKVLAAAAPLIAAQIAAAIEADQDQDGCGERDYCHGWQVANRTAARIAREAVR